MLPWKCINALGIVQDVTVNKIRILKLLPQKHNSAFPFSAEPQSGVNDIELLRVAMEMQQWFLHTVGELQNILNCSPQYKHVQVFT
jgi:hypothetical protein